jgi:hypothetical protein
VNAIRERGEIAGTMDTRDARLLKDESTLLETCDGGEVYFHENSILDGVFHKLRVRTLVRFVDAADDINS